MTTRVIFPEPGETRLQYLARVLIEYMDFFEPGLIHYDAADCDGQCLADDIQTAVESLPDLGELKKAVAFYDSYQNTPNQEPPDVDSDPFQYLLKAARKLAR